MKLPEMNQDTITSMVSYALAGAIVVGLVVYTPMLFIGILAGFTIGANKDKIQQWIDAHK
jgi:ABC-type dipeptide/oligopeptide/nickel transport system permease subunit